jgi:hypothetical protein
MTAGAEFPLALKLGHTAFVTVLVPVYWRYYGPGNFLWFSDVALLLSVPALWRGDRLLTSTQAIAVAVPETGWTIDFTIGLVRHSAQRRGAKGPRTPIGLAEYMFDHRLPRPLRAMSLFHLWLPPLLVWMVSRLGYDKRALPVQTIFGSAVLIASYRLTAPGENVNWVFGIGGAPKRRRPSRLLAALLLFPVVFYTPAHLIFSRLFPMKRGQTPFFPRGARNRQKKGSDPFSSA